MTLYPTIDTFLLRIAGLDLTSLYLVFSLIFSLSFFFSELEEKTKYFYSVVETGFYNKHKTPILQM